METTADPSLQDIKAEINSEGFVDPVNPDNSGYPCALIIGNKEEVDAILKQLEARADNKPPVADTNQETYKLSPPIKESIHEMFPFLASKQPNTLEQNVEILRKLLPLLIYDLGGNEIKPKKEINVTATIEILNEAIKPDPVKGLCELLALDDLKNHDYYILLILLRLFKKQAEIAMPIIMKNFDLFEVMPLDIHEQAVTALQKIGAEKKTDLASFFLDRAFKIAKPRLKRENGCYNFYFGVYCEVLRSMIDISIPKISKLAQTAESQGDQASLAVYYYIYKVLKNEESEAIQRISAWPETKKEAPMKKTSNPFIKWWPFNRK